MPIYPVELTVPAGTTQDKPAEAEVEIEEYTVIRFDVFFPPGCHGLVNVAVFYGSEQIAPKPAGAALKGDNELLSWPEEWHCPEKPTKLVFRGWAPNTMYPHTLLCRVITRPIEQERTISKEEELLEFLARYFEMQVGIPV